MHLSRSVTQRISSEQAVILIIPTRTDYPIRIVSELILKEIIHTLYAACGSSTCKPDGCRIDPLNVSYACKSSEIKSVFMRAWIFTYSSAELRNIVRCAGDADRSVSRSSTFDCSVDCISSRLIRSIICTADQTNTRNYIMGIVAFDDLRLRIVYISCHCDINKSRLDLSVMQDVISCILYLEYECKVLYC